MRRFVLATNQTTAEQDQALFQSIITKWPGIGWWHNLPETWLVVDLADRFTAGDLRDAVGVALPGVYCLVIDASPSQEWAAFGVKTAFAWIHEQWDRKI